MKKYYLTVERTYRLGVEFEAANDEEAEIKAAELANSDSVKAEAEISGDYCSDYALCDQDGRTILDWD